MKSIKNIIAVAVVCWIAAGIWSCSPAKGERTGHEYMPDMAHSVAYEANVYDYYYYNRWGTPEELKALSQPRLPVSGTIPRGSIGAMLASNYDEKVKQISGEGSLNGIAAPINGNVPYYYADTEEDRTRATKEIIANPFPITARGLEHGKELYNIYCGICHGDGGKGNGFLYEAGAYPAAPANLIDSVYLNSSNGRYYHAIMYGKNVMGSYKDKLSYEERWEVIHYIRSLQAKEKQKVYNEKENTFGFGATPSATLAPKVTAIADTVKTVVPATHEAGHDGHQH